MALSTKGMFDIKVWDDVEERCNNEQIKPVIANRVQLFYPLNTDVAIKKLIQVGDVLQLAYAGSKVDISCSVHVVEVLGHYQSCVKNSVIRCTSLTNCSLQALPFHKSALIFAEKDKPNKSIGFLGKCADLAGKVAEECDKMVSEISKLSDATFKALMLVKENYPGTEAERSSVIARVDNLQSDLQVAQQRMEDLEGAIDKARIEEGKTIKEKMAQPRTKQEKKSRLVFNLLGPISYIATNAEIKSNELKLTLQKEARDVNSDLNRIAADLEKMKFTDNELDASVICLEITIKMLAKVRTVFHNGRLFWAGVKRHSDSLISSKTSSALRDEDIFEACKEAFVNEIKTSGLGWLAMSKINLQAALAIRNVSHGVERTMTNLFDKDECEKLMQRLSTLIISEIAEETEMLEDTKSDWLYEVLVTSSEAVIDETEVPAEVTEESAVDLEDVGDENGNMEVEDEE